MKIARTWRMIVRQQWKKNGNKGRQQTHERPLPFYSNNVVRGYKNRTKRKNIPRRGKIEDLREYKNFARTRNRSCLCQNKRITKGAQCFVSSRQYLVKVEGKETLIEQG